MNELPGGDPPPLSDAASLFGDEPEGPAPGKPASAPGPELTEKGGYDLDESVETPVTPRIRPTLPIDDDDTPRRAVDGIERVRPARRTDSSSSGEDTSGAVSEVWTRAAEWGPDLRKLAIGVLVYLAVISFSFNLDALGVWVLIAFLGLVGLIVIAYPILITLERPVRITPEQALDDYVAALNHFRPHYRRMWLLLSDAGKAQFGGFDAFRSYWVEKQAEWKARAAKAGLGSKVALTLDDFRTENKSAGASRIDGTGALVVVAGDAQSPIFQTRGRIDFVRGSDRMWYLDTGRMPVG